MSKKESELVFTNGARAVTQVYPQEVSSIKLTDPNQKTWEWNVKGLEQDPAEIARMFSRFAWVAEAETVFDPEYGKELSLHLINGAEIRIDVVEPTEHLRVVDAQGNEVVYWSSDEWQQEGETALVLGALWGAAREPIAR